MSSSCRILRASVSRCLLLLRVDLAAGRRRRAPAPRRPDGHLAARESWWAAAPSITLQPLASASFGRDRVGEHVVGTAGSRRSASVRRLGAGPAASASTTDAASSDDSDDRPPRTTGMREAVAVCHVHHFIVAQNVAPDPQPTCRDAAAGGQPHAEHGVNDKKARKKKRPVAGPPFVAEPPRGGRRLTSEAVVHVELDRVRGHAHDAGLPASSGRCRRRCTHR